MTSLDEQLNEGARSSLYNEELHIIKLKRTQRVKCKVEYFQPPLLLFPSTSTELEIYIKYQIYSIRKQHCNRSITDGKKETYHFNFLRKGKNHTVLSKYRETFPFHIDCWFSKQNKYKMDFDSRKVKNFGSLKLSIQDAIFRSNGGKPSNIGMPQSDEDVDEEDEEDPDESSSANESESEEEVNRVQVTKSKKRRNPINVSSITSLPKKRRKISPKQHVKFRQFKPPRTKDEKRREEEEKEEEEDSDTDDDEDDEEDDGPYTNRTNLRNSRITTTSKKKKQSEKIEIQETEQEKRRKSNVKEMREWLSSKEVDAEMYVDMLVNNGFDCMHILLDIDEDTLKNIGVERIGHRRKILKQIKKHRMENNIGNAWNVNCYRNVNKCFHGKGVDKQTQTDAPLEDVIKAKRRESCIRSGSQSHNRSRRGSTLKGPDWTQIFNKGENRDDQKVAAMADKLSSNENKNSEANEEQQAKVDDKNVENA